MQNESVIIETRGGCVVNVETTIQDKDIQVRVLDYDGVPEDYDCETWDEVHAKLYGKREHRMIY